MASANSEFTEYVLGQLDPSGAVRSRKMFGGTGVYVDDVFCAIISGSGCFYLRVGDSNRPDFEAENMAQFSGRGSSLMPYFEVPPRVLEDAQELGTWVGKARSVAIAANSKKKPRAGDARSGADKRRRR